jgi:O-antigen/teichoic acid export membrane protein
MKRLRIKMGSDRMWRNFRLVASANVISQLMLVLAAPVLARLFNPSAFGVLALYTTITTLITAMATLRVDWLIPNARSARSAASLFAAGSCVLIIVVVAITLFLTIHNTESLFKNQYSLLNEYSFFIPLGILGVSTHQLFHGWYVRSGNLLPISRTKITQSVGYLIFSLTFGWLSFGAAGLIGAALIASWMGISILIHHSDNLSRHLRSLTVIRTTRLFWIQRKRILLSTAVSVLNSASATAMILLLALVYDAAEVGILAFTHRLLAAPVGLIAEALAQSFWSHAAELVRGRQYIALQSDYLRLSGLLLLLAAAVAVGCFIAIPLIVPVFGEEWRDMGTVLILLLPLITGTIVVSPTNHLIVFNRQGLQLYADAFRLGLVCASVGLAVTFDWPFFWALLGVSVGSLIGHVTLFIIHIQVHKSLARSGGNGTQT